MKKRLQFLLCLLMSAYTFAQQSLNMNFLSSYSYNQELSDIWGYATESGEYALVGVFDGVSVVDITNPSEPNEIGFFSGPNSIWRDIKTYGDYLYCVNESSGGLHIINLAEVIAGVQQPTNIQNVDLGFTTGHNIFIDENGVLYVLGSNYGVGGAMMFDLNTDPQNPTFLGNYNGSYFHDAMVRGDTLWGGAIYNGEFSVVDVTDKENPVLLATQSTPSSFTHNCWISDDGNTVFTTDEVSGAFVTSYDVSDLNDLQELDRIQAWSPETDVIPHNTFVDGDFVITSYYTDGVSVVDGSHPSNLIEVGYFDTSTGYSGNGFNGAWGVYPYLPSGNIIVSDIENGLYVLERKFTNASFIEGTITNSITGAPISNVSVHIQGSNNPTTSALNGFYESGMALEGEYDMWVSAEGYTDQMISININSTQTTIVNIELIPSGCMDPDACNYNPFAVTDDGSCAEYDICGECGGTGPIPGYDCQGNCISEIFTIEMMDSYGDGWNGNTLNINTMNFGFSSGYSATETFCYDPNMGCLEVICDGGSWQNEVSWTISDANGTILSGGAPFQGELCEFISNPEICQTIDFPAGWTLFSTYIQADDMNLANVLTPLLVDNNLVIVKNYVGAAFLPSWSINGIGDIEIEQGYLAKNNFEQSLEICGEYKLPEENPITLNQGWGMFSYLRLEPANVVDVLSDFTEDVIIVKDIVGNVYLPDWNFNAIGNLEAGKGYQIKMNATHTLLYLSNEQEY